MFVRVKDPGTGHEFDVPEGDPALDRLVLVDQDRWPPAHTARPPKHHLDSAGITALAEAGALDTLTATDLATESVRAFDLAGPMVTRPESPRPVTARKHTPKEK